MSRSAVDKQNHGVETDVLNEDLGVYLETQNESTVKHFPSNYVLMLEIHTHNFSSCNSYKKLI